MYNLFSLAKQLTLGLNSSSHLLKPEIDYEDLNDFMNIRLSRPALRPPSSSSKALTKPGTAIHSRNPSGGGLIQTPFGGIACPPINAYHLDNLNQFARDTNGKGGEVKYQLKTFLTSRKFKDTQDRRVGELLKKKFRAIEELDRHRKMKERVHEFKKESFGRVHEKRVSHR